MKKVIRRYWVQLILAGIAILATCLIIFRKQISDHKVTQAKIEAFKRMSQSTPKKWPQEVRHVFDSIIVQQIDSTANTRH